MGSVDERSGRALCPARFCDIARQIPEMIESVYQQIHTLYHWGIYLFCTVL